uniref:Replication-associated protein n=1 Tax=Emberiza tristrami Genomoviridae sp. TaxID=2814951 RepID=A0A8E7L5G0_9VIRU|nr:MAG: replication-associated protein [Emberiza tristrami Genomoviridae sp.]
MSSLPMPNVERSMLWLLSDLLDQLVASVSSEKSCMLMGEFISIVSCNGSLSSQQRTNANSILMDATQIFGKCIAHRKRDMLTQLKMEKLLEVLSRPSTSSLMMPNCRAEIAIADGNRRGLKLSWQALVMSFSNLARGWIHDHSALDLWGSANTLTGGIEWTDPLTVRPGEYLLRRPLYQHCVTGYERTWEHLKVSDAPLGAGSHRVEFRF